MSDEPIQIGRAPVLALWASVVAERLGLPPNTALTLGWSVSSGNARIKARSLGMTEEALGEEERSAHATAAASKGEMVRLMGRDIPVVKIDHTLVACVDGKPVSADGARAYLALAYGDRLNEVRSEMAALAATLAPEELNRVAFRLYEAFRPDVPHGPEGWDAQGILHIDRIRGAAGQIGT
jgi:hypothetical protein